MDRIVVILLMQPYLKSRSYDSQVASPPALVLTIAFHISKFTEEQPK